MGLPITNVPSHFFNAMDSFVLMAIPYFLLAGNLMTYMGTARKMLGFINNLLGHLPGGVPAAAVVAATIFGALSGSATATVIAVGSMMIPEMVRLGYSKKNSMGVVAAAGTLGQMIPPSIFMILYASIVQLNVSDLFLAGIVPGLVIAGILIITTVFISLRENKVRKERAPFKDIVSSFFEALPALLMLVIVLGGIYSGVFTPTEAAAVSVVYVVIVSFLFNREEFTKENLLKSLHGTMVTTAVIFIILGGATLFATSLTYAQIPQGITEFVTSISFPGWAIMILVLLLILVFGMFLDAVPILYITVPILYPVIISLGYDPIHFGIIMVALLMIGQVTPPVGMSLFAITGYFKENLSVSIRGVIPYLYALVIATIIIVYVPWLSTFLLK